MNQTLQSRSFSLQPDQVKQFETQGFLIAKSEDFRELKTYLQSALKDVALQIIDKLPEFKDASPRLKTLPLRDLIAACIELEKTTKTRATALFYEIFPKTLEVMSVLTHPTVVALCKSVGLATPIAGTVPVTRIDRPREDFYATPLHQDYWYSFLCPNSVVVWFTIFEITPDMGFLKAVPGTHKLGVVPFKKWDEYEPFVALYDAKDSEFVEVDLRDDEVLIFNQKLLHQSGQNRGAHPRLSMQLRFNDLATQEKITSSFTPVHSKHVFEQQQLWLEKFKK